MTASQSLEYLLQLELRQLEPERQILVQESVMSVCDFSLWERKATGHITAEAEVFTSNLQELADSLAREAFEANAEPCSVTVYAHGAGDSEFEEMFSYGELEYSRMVGFKKESLDNE